VSPIYAMVLGSLPHVCSGPIKDVGRGTRADVLDEATDPRGER